MFSRINRIIAPILVVVLLLTVTTGCTKQKAKNEQTMYERFGLKFTIPENYAGEIDFAPADELDDNTYLKAYHIFSRNAGCGGWLYSIVRHTRDEFNEYKSMMEGPGGAKHIASDENYVYSLEFPTDVQIAPEYWESSENNTAANLTDLINEDGIIADFIERNGLTPYEESISFEDVSLPAFSPEVGKFIAKRTSDSIKTHRLGAIPVECKIDRSTEIVYLTSITLRNDSAMCNFVCSSKDSPLPIFPDIIAVTADGSEYKISAGHTIKGAAVFECSDVPVDEIKTLKISGKEFQVDARPNLSGTDVFKERLKDLSSMDYAELFAYCRGSDAAYSEGVYYEMYKRFIKNPEEFAAHMMMPAYPFANDYRKSLSSVIDEYSSSEGFDWPTNYEICYNVLIECTPEERDTAIKSLSSSKYEVVKEVNELFTIVAENLNKS